MGHVNPGSQSNILLYAEIVHLATLGQLCSSRLAVELEPGARSVEAACDELKS